MSMNDRKIDRIPYGCSGISVIIVVIISVLFYKRCFCDDDILLTGKLKNLEAGELLLFSENNEEADSIPVGTDGTFVCRFAMDEPSGIYMLYIPQTSTSVYLYLRKGARIHVMFDPAQAGQYPRICGNVSNECEIVRKMNEEFIPRDLEEIARMSFPEYRKGIMEEYTKITELLEKVKDKDFVNSVTEELNARKDYHLYCYRASYKLYVSPEGDVPDEMFRKFAKGIDLDKPENARSGLTNLVLVWDLQAAGKPRSDINILYELRRRVSNQEVLDYISERCLGSSLVNETSIKNLEEVYTLFTRTCRDSKMLQDMGRKYESAIKALHDLSRGKELLDIEMEDRYGNRTSISALKGRVRYVDVWASWCGPCHREIPFLEKLVERRRKDGHLEIIGLSIDEDRNAWLKNAPSDRPGWKQYRATEHSRKMLEDEYGITAIPRFMLFDENDRIIDVHAPFPSDTEIDILLRDYLVPEER